MSNKIEEVETAERASLQTGGVLDEKTPFEPLEQLDTAVEAALDHEVET
jgi:hypothetical protein